jgi:hypothetical protein
MQSQLVEALKNTKPRKNPLLCRLGLHDWYTVSYQVGVWVSWTVERCRKCPNERSVARTVL